MILVSDLVADVRRLANLKRSISVFDDDDIAQLLSDAGRELQDRFIASAIENHYFITTFDFSLTSDDNAVDLPTNFMKANLLQLNPTATRPTTVPMLSNFLDRNSGKYGYDITDDDIAVWPRDRAQGVYQLLYTYTFPNLVAGQPLAIASEDPDTIVRFATAEPMEGTWEISSGDTIRISTDGYPQAPLVDGGQPVVGDRLLFQHGSVAVPESPDLFGIWVYQGIEEGQHFYDRAEHYTENETIEAGHTIGVTEGTTYAGTTRATTTEWRVAVDFVDVVSFANVVASTASMSFESASFNSRYVGATINIRGSAANDGDWVIASVTDSTTVVVLDPDSELVDEDLTSAVVAVVYFPGEAIRLSTTLDQWALYLKVHAAIAIRTARQQETTDLQRKLLQQIARVTQMAQHRTEDVVQAPLRRRRR